MKGEGDHRLPKLLLPTPGAPLGGSRTPPGTERVMGTVDRRQSIVGVSLMIICSAGSACTPSVEEWPAEATAVFRRHSDAFERCPVDEPAYHRVIADWLRRRPPAAPLTGLSLGRAIDFPWISSYLAERALDHRWWDTRRGKVRHGDLNGVAAAILSEEKLLARLAAPFCDTPHVPVAVSVEKVLVGPADGTLAKPGIGTRLVPHDAQIWLRIEHRGAASSAPPAECR